MLIHEFLENRDPEDGILDLYGCGFAPGMAREAPKITVTVLDTNKKLFAKFDKEATQNKESLILCDGNYTSHLINSSGLQAITSVDEEYSEIHREREMVVLRAHHSEGKTTIFLRALCSDKL